MWKTKRDFVLDGLRRAIISGELQPGQPLSYEELARRYDVSLTPIREALRELVADGLVVSEPHKGVKVREFSLAEAYQVFTIRACLERLVAQLTVPKITNDDIEMIRREVERMQEGFRTCDLELVRQANQDFHFGLYRLTGWAKLEEMMTVLWRQSPWSMLRLIEGRTERSIQEHIQMMDAIAARDVARSEELLAGHVINARDELVADLGQPMELALVVG